MTSENSEADKFSSKLLQEHTKDFRLIMGKKINLKLIKNSIDQRCKKIKEDWKLKRFKMTMKNPCSCS